jgi:hypothetical protein
MGAITQVLIAASGRGWLWQRLDPEDMILAYPMALAVEDAGLDRRRWCRGVRCWLGASRHRRGAMALRGYLATVVALFLYDVDDRRPGTPHLSVPRLWMVELGRPGHVARIMLAAIEATARETGCAAVVLDRRHIGVRRLAETLDVEHHGYGPVGTGTRCLHRLAAAAGDA